MQRRNFLAGLATVFGMTQATKTKKKPKIGGGAGVNNVCSMCARYTSTSSTQGLCQLEPKVFTVSGINAWQFPTMQSTDSCSHWAAASPAAYTSP